MSNSINIYTDTANHPHEILFNGPTLGNLEITTGSKTNGFTFTQSLLLGANNDSVDKSDILDPIISYGNTSTEAVHFINGTASLNVYTKTETDA